MLLLIGLMFCIFQNTSGIVGHDYIFPPLPIAVTDGNIVCERQSREYRDNLDNFTLWAYEMRDATAQSMTSVLRGSVFSMGNYQQCLTARAPFPTQYCLVEVTANVTKFKIPADPFSLYHSPIEQIIDKLHYSGDVTQLARNVVKMGWCFPSSCTTSEAEKSLNKYLENLDYPLRRENVTFSANINPVFCQSSNQESAFDIYDILFCILALVLILIVVSATIWDFNCVEVTKKNRMRDLILAFSARENFLDLAKFENSDKSLAILHGIKTYSMCMIIMCHKVALPISGPIKNFDKVEKTYRDPSLAYLFHGDLFVDTFFVISGLLGIYTLMGARKKGLMNPGLVILLRYMRLTPAYGFMIFFCATVLYHSGNGALWEAVIGSERVDCRHTWWTNILYVSNYVDVEHTCLLPFWYLPCDFHFFLIAVGLLVLYNKSKKVALLVQSILAILSILVPFSIIYYYETQAFLRFLPDFQRNHKSHEDTVMTYTKTHTRAAPYFIGMVAGYIFYKIKDKVKLSKLYANTVLAISFALLIITLSTGSIYYNPYHTYNALEHALYGSFHRPIWALGTVGFIFAIGYGERGFIYNCLAWKVWVSIGKLVFGAYLVHFPLVIRNMAMTNSPNTVQLFDIISESLSYIVLGFVLGLVLYLLVEAPSKKLVQMMMAPAKHSEKASKDNESSTL